MQRLDVSGAVRPIYGSLGVKRYVYKGAFLLVCDKNSQLTSTNDNRLYI